MSSLVKIFTILMLSTILQMGTIDALNRRDFAIEVHGRLSSTKLGTNVLNILQKIFPKLKRFLEIEAAYEVDAIEFEKKSLQEYYEKNEGKSWEDLKKDTPGLTDKFLYDRAAKKIDSFLDSDMSMRVQGEFWTPEALLANTTGNMLVDILTGPKGGESDVSFKTRIQKGLTNLATNEALYVKGSKKLVFDTYFDRYQKEELKGVSVNKEDVKMPDFLDFMANEGVMSLTGLNSEKRFNSVRDMNYNEFSQNKDFVNEVGEGFTIFRPE
ncbi:MAG: hypothetical protein WD068_03175 [Candidatus Babeliales bacterium]